MSFNIMDMVKGQVSDQLIGQIGGLLGESPDKARSAVDSAMPTLLAGIGESAQDANGADALFNLVNRQDDSVVDNIGSMIGSNQSSDLIESGTRGLGSLIGSKGVTSMISGLSGHTGLGKGSAGSLLGLLTPMVLGQLKRKSGTDGLNASGLASMLKNQGSNISAALPDGMLKQLEVAGFGDARTHATTTTTTGGYAGSKVAAGAAAATAGVAATASAASRGASNVASGAATATRGAVGGATSTVNRGASGAATATRSAAGAVTDTAKGAAGSVSRGVGNATDAASNAASSAGRTVSGATRSAADTTRSAANTAGRTVDRGVDAAGNKVGGAVDRTRTAASNTTDRNTTTTTTEPTRTRSTTETRTTYEEPKRSGGFWKWLIPLALAALAWFGFNQLNNKDEVVVDEDAAATVSENAEATTTAAADATGDLGGQFGSFLGSTQETLDGITDTASATAALPGLEAAQSKLTGLTDMLGGADDSAKSAVSSAVSEGMGGLGSVVERLQGDAGIWDIVKGVVGPMMDTLKGLAG